MYGSEQPFRSQPQPVWRRRWDCSARSRSRSSFRNRSSSRLRRRDAAFKPSVAARSRRRSGYCRRLAPAARAEHLPPPKPPKSAKRQEGRRRSDRLPGVALRVDRHEGSSRRERAGTGDRRGPARARSMPPPSRSAPSATTSAKWPAWCCSCSRTSKRRPARSSRGGSPSIGSGPRRAVGQGRCAAQPVLRSAGPRAEDRRVRDPDSSLLRAELAANAAEQAAADAAAPGGPDPETIQTRANDATTDSPTSTTSSSASARSISCSTASSGLDGVEQRLADRRRARCPDCSS